MKNIALIIPNLGFGGAQNALIGLYTELKKRGYFVKIIAFECDNTFEAAKYKEDLIFLPIHQSKSIFEKILYFFKRLFHLRKIKRALNITHAISFLEGANYLNVLSRYKKTYISLRGSIVHDPNIRGLKGKIRKKILVPLIYNKADKIILLTEEAKSEMINIIGLKENKIKVIPNFLISQKINKSPKQEDIICFGLHSRLAPEKGLHELLNIFIKLKQKTKVPFRLKIIGSGREEHYLKSITKKNKLGDIVIFIPFHPKPLTQLSDCDAYIFFSYTEGFGLALAEALNLNIPIFSADCPNGPATILDKRSQSYPEKTKYGILLPPFKQNHNNTEALGVWVKTLQHFLAYPDAYKKKYSHVSQRLEDFSPDKIIALWESLF